MKTAFYVSSVAVFHILINVFIVGTALAAVRGRKPYVDVFVASP